MDTVLDNLERLSLASSSDDGEHNVQADIAKLSAEVKILLNKLYELQELRYSSSTTTPRVEAGIHQLDEAIQLIPSRLEGIQAAAKQLSGSSRISSDLNRLHADLEEASCQHAALRLDVKEDGWLQRFKTTADQAETMMVPVEASLQECLRYIESISALPTPVPQQSEIDDSPSIQKLLGLETRHRSMRKTYMPSISKILKIMEKSLTDRASKNGEALRRYGDMTSRWTTLQRQLQQLDARISQIIKQHLSSPAPLSPGAIETLDDHPSSGASTPFDYFGKVVNGSKPPSSHRSSFSSATSKSSVTPSKPPSAYPAGLSPGPSPHPLLRRKSSFMSSTSSSTAKIVERMPSGPLKTPTNRRVSSMTARPGAASPTPSQASVTSSVMSGPRSRIPIASPSARLSVPSLSVSTSTTHTFLDNNEEVLKTPDPRNGFGTSRSSSTVPRASLTPSNRAFSSAPRGSKGPPSSFRSFTPTPSARPSSRLSMMSYAPSAIAPVNLQPFQPSRYDLLDTTVQMIIAETGFNLFVARVDPAMKRGQRRRDDEEWKGEFVFGAGQKTSPVKLLKLAGRTGRDEAARMKCLVRVQGAWQDLATVLRKRQAEAPAAELESP